MYYGEFENSQFPCSLCVIDIDNIRPVSDVVLLPC